MQGSERIYRCLAGIRDQMTINCQTTLFDHELRMIESIDFQMPTKQACLSEIRTLCANSGQPVVRCLREKLGSGDLSDKCREVRVCFMLVVAVAHATSGPAVT